MANNNTYIDAYKQALNSGSIPNIAEAESNARNRLALLKARANNSSDGRYRGLAQQLEREMSHAKQDWAVNAMTNKPAQPTSQQGTAATSQQSKTPYLDIAGNYESQARANLANQEQAMAKQLAASKQGTNASYNSAAAGNYINYMKQQNALPEQLARQGINGGASESAMTRIGNNYAMNQGNTTAQRNAALAQLQSAYDTNLANMRNTAEENIMNNRMALQQSQVQYDDTLAQRAAEEARYREEVERRARERLEDFAREDRIRQEGYDREDRIRDLTWGREDTLYNRDTAREDELRNLTWTREDKQRAEDRADEKARYEYEKQAAAQQNAQAEAWRQAEWQKAQIDQQIEQFAAGLLQYTDVKTLQNLRNEVMAVNPNWANDPLLYGYVMAFNNRIGVVKAEQAAAKAAKKKKK